MSGINQRVAGSRPAAGANKTGKCQFFMFYIYILFSSTSKKYYVGYSNDPQRRVLEHNTKPFNTYTSKHRPWNLVAANVAIMKKKPLK